MSEDAKVPETQEELLHWLKHFGFPVHAHTWLVRSVDEIMHGSSSAGDLQQKLITENYIYLEDSSPAARVRAYDWLAKQKIAPAGGVLGLVEEIPCRIYVAESVVVQEETGLCRVGGQCFEGDQVVVLADDDLSRRKMEGFEEQAVEVVGARQELGIVTIQSIFI